MKLRILAVLMIAFLSIAVTGCGDSDDAATETLEKSTVQSTEEPAAEAAFAIGDHVAAEWGDGNLYLAEVTAISGPNVTVTYLDDNTEGELDESVVFAIEERDWEVGDQVLAVWAVARFYSGTIQSTEGGSYIVDWDDGSEPSEVSSDLIIEYQAKYGSAAE